MRLIFETRLKEGSKTHGCLSERQREQLLSELSATSHRAFHCRHVVQAFALIADSWGLMAN